VWVCVLSFTIPEFLRSPRPAPILVVRPRPPWRRLIHLTGAKC
jgi:hypothetical protein